MEQYWEKASREAKERKELEKQYLYLGKKVRRKSRSRWEEGVVIIDKFPDGLTEEEQFIKFSDDDIEQLFGLPFQVWDEEKHTWSDDEICPPSNANILR